MATRIRTSVNRRRFLQASLAGTSLLSPAGHASASAAQASRKADVANEQQVLERLKGPMASITIPYNKDYSIDHGSLREWVDFMGTCSCRKRPASSTGIARKTRSSVPVLIAVTLARTTTPSSAQAGISASSKAACLGPVMSSRFI